MATANLVCYLEYVSGQSPFEIGSRLPVSIASQTVKHVGTYSLATATNKVILDVGSASTSDISDFDLFVLVADQDLSLQIIGSVTANNSNIKTKANVPFILPFSKTRVYNASGAFAGALEDISSITVRNDSGSTTTINIFAST